MGKFKPFFQEGDRVVCYKGDCLEVMPELEGPVDMILADLPYQMTSCEWDKIIPFEPMWECYKRLIKPNGAVVLFGSQPFTSALVMSNLKWFKYCWVWEKSNGTGINAENRPVPVHEDICVFYKNQATYIPQRWQIDSRFVDRRKQINPKKINDSTKGAQKNRVVQRIADDGWRNPTSVIACGNERIYHPTQKPLDLLSYLIKSYTKPNDLILDNTAGSFSTGVAAILNGRRFVGIEKESVFCEIGEKRIRDAITEVDSMLIKPWEIEAPTQPEHEQGDLFAVG